MKKTSPHKVVIVFLVSLIAFRGYSQNNFNYKAAIKEINETKFYRLDLPPKVVAKCLPGLQDIRIFDKEGKQVPYILKNDLPAFRKENFTEFPVIKTDRQKDKQTHVIIENVSGKPVNNLLLFIKNTDAHREFSLSGSDDSTHWFIIKENIYLDNSFSSDGENIIQTLSFPPANYKYFQLTILGENLLPFNIIKAGIYKEDITYGSYVRIPAPSISQKDSANKKSYIFLNFTDAYQINKLNLDINGAKYFNRKIEVFEHRKRGKDFILNGDIRSDAINSFILNCKSDQLLVVIDNEDNVPLKVDTAEAFQLNVSLLTYLEKGESYSLYFGDSIAKTPVYDLQSFSDSVENNPSGISLKSIAVNKNEIVVGKSFFKNNRLVLWIIITGVLLALCFFTFKLIGEVNKKRESNT